MKMAAIYRRKGKILIHSQSKTVDGVWIASDPFHVLRYGEVQDKIESAIAAALSSSRTGVPHPTNWKLVSRPILDHMGVKSWATFVKGTEFCLLEEEGNVVKVIPHHNLGSEGFEQDLDQVVEVDRGDYSSALDKGWARCTN